MLSTVWNLKFFWVASIKFESCIKNEEQQYWALTSLVAHLFCSLLYFDTTGMREMITARDIVSSIISAANRKIQRRRKGHDEPDNDDHEDEKVGIFWGIDHSWNIQGGRRSGKAWKSEKKSGSFIGQGKSGIWRKKIFQKSWNSNKRHIK